MLSPNDIPQDSLETLHSLLRKNGCSGCKLGQQEDLQGPVFYRGNLSARWAIYGEAPGKEENRTGVPFCGPAGKLLDQMVKYMNLSTEQLPIFSNVSLCRPIAPPGAGKENVRPQEIDKNVLSLCRPWTKYLLSSLDIHFIVLAGGTAVDAFLPNIKKKSLTELLGRTFFNLDQWPGIAFFPIYHPAFLLRKKNNPEAYKPYQKRTQNLLDIIKEIVLELW